MGRCYGCSRCRRQALSRGALRVSLPKRAENTVRSDQLVRFIEELVNNDGLHVVWGEHLLLFFK